ncbi:unnamed protein product [Echinostoma caproni]|uniref:Reverse transcriptase domain-containing protein n=1 Tax=Echinostoma caproni TaxID=27848 RepID=A0A183A5F7_9TREM|nr:unnamed protein product [Echinostoma caproni]
MLSKARQAFAAELLMEYLEKHEILFPTQHEFQHKRTCTTNLPVARDEWTKSDDAGDPLGIVYLDFSKGFV